MSNRSNEMVVDHAKLMEQDKHQLHPLQHPNRHKDPLMVESGEGVWLYTTDGRKVLDGMAGLWNVNIGYGNQTLGDVARDQILPLAAQRQTILHSRRYATIGNGRVRQRRPRSFPDNMAIMA